MKRLENIEYLLIFGMIILFFAGFSLAINEIIGHSILRCLILLIIAGVFYLMSFVFKKVLKLDLTNKAAYGLGSVMTVCTFISAGVYKVFGDFFSLTGDGVLVFLSSISLLIGILALLTMVLYKNYNLIHITFLSIIFMISFLLAFYKVNYTVLMLIIMSVLFILNIFKNKEATFEFSSFAIPVSVFISLFLFNDDSNIVLSFILFIINIISLFSVINNKKTLEHELLSIIALSGVFVVFSSYLYTNFNTNVALIVSVGIISIIDLILSTFRIIDVKAVKIIYKFINIAILALLLLDAEFNAIAHLIVITFILITSVVDTFAIHNDDYERYFLPFKVMFLSCYLVSFVSQVYSSLIFGIEALIFALIYRKFNNLSIKPMYAIIVGLSILLLVVNLSTSLLTNVLAFVLILLTSIVIKNKDNDKLANVVDGFIAFMFLIISDRMNLLESLILVIVIGIYVYIHRDKKLIFGASIFSLGISVNTFLYHAIKNSDVYLILTTFMTLILIGIALEILFDKDMRNKNIFAGILFGLVLYDLLVSIDSFIAILYSLIVALSLMLLSITKKGYNSLFYVCLVFGSLYVFEFFSLIEDFPASLYILIISIVLIIGTSIIAYKRINSKEDVQEKKAIIDNCVNYCSECGSKITKSDTYCSECGNKVR